MQRTRASLPIVATERVVSAARRRVRVARLLAAPAPPDLASASLEYRLADSADGANPTSDSVQDPARAAGSHQTPVPVEKAIRRSPVRSSRTQARRPRRSPAAVPLPVSACSKGSAWSHSTAARLYHSIPTHPCRRTINPASCSISLLFHSHRSAGREGPAPGVPHGLHA